jgi:hypothetical protein
MGDYFIFLPLAIVGLFLWIQWDSEKMDAAARKAVKKRPKHQSFAPQARISQWGLAGAAVTLALWALILFAHPPKSPFTGRLSIIPQLLNGLFGEYGPAIAAVGASLICLAIFLKRLRGKSDL